MVKRFVAGLAALVGIAPSAQALDFRDTILFVLETHPEISAAAANKQALEFELDQSRSFFAPRFST